MRIFSSERDAICISNAEIFLSKSSASLTASSKERFSLLSAEAASNSLTYERSLPSRSLQVLSSACMRTTRALCEARSVVIALFALSNDDSVFCRRSAWLNTLLFSESTSAARRMSSADVSVFTVPPFTYPGFSTLCKDAAGNAVVFAGVSAFCAWRECAF